jgi:hypothetical protein
MSDTHLIGLGDEAPRDTSPTLAAHDDKYKPGPLNPACEPVTLADVLDALNVFSRPNPSEDDGPWEGGHFIRVDYLPDFINVIATAWFQPQVLRAENERLTAERDALRAEVERWKGLYRRALNAANWLTNYVEDRPELRRIERELEKITGDARAAIDVAAAAPKEG